MCGVRKVERIQRVLVPEMIDKSELEQIDLPPPSKHDKDFEQANKFLNKRVIAIKLKTHGQADS